MTSSMAKSLEVPRNRIIGFYHLGNIFCAKRWLNRHIYIKTRWPTCMNLSTDYQIVRKFSIRLKRIIGFSLINEIFLEVFFAQNVINSILEWPTCFFYQISSEFRGNFSDFNIKVEFRETYFFLRRFFRVPWLILGFLLRLIQWHQNFGQISWESGWFRYLGCIPRNYIAMSKCQFVEFRI